MILEIGVRLRRLAENISAAHGARAEVEIDQGFPVRVNDARISDLARRTARALYGEEAWVEMKHPTMGTEDVFYVLHRTAGAMVFLGAAPEGGDYRTCCALHSNRMMLDETVMVLGIAMHRAMAEAALSGDLELQVDIAPALDPLHSLDIIFI